MTEKTRAEQFNEMVRTLRSMGITLRRQLSEGVYDNEGGPWAHYAFAGGEGLDPYKHGFRQVGARDVKQYVARWDVYPLEIHFFDDDQQALRYLVRHVDGLQGEVLDPHVLLGSGPGGVALLCVHNREVTDSFVRVEDLRAAATPDARQ